MFKSIVDIDSGYEIMTPEEVAHYLRKSLMGLQKRRYWAVGSSEVLCFSQQRRTSMSVYFIKGKGWRYDFTLKGIRHTESWFKTKTKAREAEAEKRKELENPTPEPETSTDMAFLDLVNLRLDHVKAYNSESHYRDVFYHARRWTKAWGETNCSEISRDMIEEHIINRSKISRHVANKDLQYIRALFNFGIERKVVLFNPTAGIPFMPIEKRKKYVPPKEDVLKVISAADPDTQHYLWTILLTAGRVSEINKLTWDDVSFGGKYVTLWTRKRKGGHREPREIPMVKMLYDVLRTDIPSGIMTCPGCSGIDTGAGMRRSGLRVPTKTESVS